MTRTNNQNTKYTDSQVREIRNMHVVYGMGPVAIANALRARIVNRIEISKCTVNGILYGGSRMWA